VKVLVTGAGGNLARVVIPALAAAGHTLRLLDFRPIDTAHDLLQGDLRNPDDLARAVDGVDAVVHAAALHGIHRGHWSTRDFWAINVDGTFHLYEAATTAKVAKVVLASSMAVYGASMQPPADAWGIVAEDSPILPDDESRSRPATPATTGSPISPGGACEPPFPIPSRGGSEPVPSPTTPGPTARDTACAEHMVAQGRNQRPRPLGAPASPCTRPWSSRFYGRAGSRDTQVTRSR